MNTLIDRRLNGHCDIVLDLFDLRFDRVQWVRHFGSFSAFGLSASAAACDLL